MLSCSGKGHRMSKNNELFDGLVGWKSSNKALFLHNLKANYFFLSQFNSIFTSKHVAYSKKSIPYVKTLLFTLFLQFPYD